jgi:hypothetical protein
MISTHHDGKDTLLHFSRVFRSENDHFHTLEVDLDGRRTAHTLGKAVRRELASVVDDKIGLAKVGEFFFRWTDQHVVLERDP